MPASVRLTAPKFGQWLQLQRGARSLEQIAIKVRPLVRSAGLKVDQSLIYKLEQGRVPSWPLFGALCRVYDQDPSTAVLLLMQSIEFPGASDLLRQSNGLELASEPASQEGGRLDDHASARALADQIRKMSEDFAGAVQDVADRILGGVEDAPDPHAARSSRRRSARVRHPRKLA